MNVLSYRRNDSLVFDTTGKCVLRLHSPEDIKLSTGGNRLGPDEAGSSKGKKRPAKPLLKTPVPPKKRRRQIKDSDDELLLAKSKVPPLPDQSMEGSYFILPT